MCVNLPPINVSSGKSHPGSLLKSFLPERASHCSSDPQRGTRRYPHAKVVPAGFGTLQNTRQGHTFQYERPVVNVNCLCDRASGNICVVQIVWIR